MRSILCWLPALALVACQADVPTATDQSIQAERTLPDNKEVLLADRVMDTANEDLVFVIPSETRELNRARLMVGYATGWYYIVPWLDDAVTDATGDGVDDLLLLFDGYTACRSVLLLIERFELNRSPTSDWQVELDVWFTTHLTPDITKNFSFSCEYDAS